MPPIPLTVEDMEELRCDCCGVSSDEEPSGGGLVFKSSCHPYSGTLTSYHGGIITVLCGGCRAVVVEIQVARKEPEAPAEVPAAFLREVAGESRPD